MLPPGIAMSLPPLAIPATGFFALLAIATWLLWRSSRSALRSGLEARKLAKETGSHHARLEHPWVDLSRCIGCASCIRACPEQGVLDLLHGQAAVVHGSRCIGHGECAANCPVGAIALTMADRKDREDLPALLPEMEAIGSPGLFLAGEVTGYALIRTAVDHGTRSARGAFTRKQQANLRSPVIPNGEGEQLLDLCIIGAGPAGLACSLEAKRLGLNFITLEQDRIGGTIARYPRQKLINTHEITLPLGGKIEGRTYQKSELMELWTKLCFDHQLPIQEGFVLESVQKDQDESFTVKTEAKAFRTRSVCLALGRRGIPNKLNVPGEDLLKVNYSLIDAHAYQNGNFLVVGGGDSAIEAALGLAEQTGNQVHLSYRRSAFFRLRARNHLLLQEALREKRIQVHLETTVHSIELDRVLLKREGKPTPLLAIPNDQVFVLIGGSPPMPILKEAGVSFDPALGPNQDPPAERGVGLLLPFLVATLAVGILLIWGLWNADYYQANALDRLSNENDNWLRPAKGVGLFAGIAAAFLICTNLLYLVRRSRSVPLKTGSLSKWMSAHISTGMLALVLAILHSGFSWDNNLGGHAIIGLAFLVGTGALGRYFYSFVPRVANGREQALEEALMNLHTNAKSWASVHRGFGETARREIAELIDRTRWHHGAVGSIVGLIKSQRDLRLTTRRLASEGRRQKVDATSLSQVLQVAKRAHRDALVAGHFEDIRSLLASWRYLHRWAGLLVVLLLAAHIWYAYRYGNLGGSS